MPSFLIRRAPLVPVAFVLALLVSLGLHVFALFGPEIEFSREPALVPLEATLLPTQKIPTKAPVQTPAQTPTQPPEKLPVKPQVARAAAAGQPVAPNQTKGVQKKPQDTLLSSSVAPVTTPVFNAPESTNSASSTEVVADTPVERERLGATGPLLQVSLEAVERFPKRGKIQYRVDRGDSNFEIGISQHEWQIADGHYRLLSITETSGIVSLFKRVRIEMDSRGRLSEKGLQPESFEIRRDGKVGKKGTERALFDWVHRRVKIGEQAEQALADGTQDFLSFNYQLGFMAHPETGSAISIVTGRKYNHYRLEVLGDEEIELPIGRLRTLHLRAPGVSTAELWLAYDHWLLPVKIRFVDNDGVSYVQVATQVQLNLE